MSSSPTSSPPRLSGTGGLLCALLCLAVCCACAPAGDGRGQPQPPPRAAATPKEGQPNMSGDGGQTAASTDARELGRLVTLPYEPRSVVWQRRTRGADGPVPGPTDWSVVCVLELSDADAVRLAAGAGGASKKVKVFDWFPEAVRRRAGDDGLLEGQALDAAPFYKSPLNNGSLVRVPETNYFVLALYTM